MWRRQFSRIFLNEVYFDTDITDPCPWGTSPYNSSHFMASWGNYTITKAQKLFEGVNADDMNNGHSLFVYVVLLWLPPLRITRVV